MPIPLKLPSVFLLIPPITTIGDIDRRADAPQFLHRDDICVRLRLRGVHCADAEVVRAVCCRLLCLLERRYGNA